MTQPEVALRLCPLPDGPAEGELDELLEYLAGQVYWELIFPAETERDARALLGRLNGRLFLMLNDIFPHPARATPPHLRDVPAMSERLEG